MGGYIEYREYLEILTQSAGSTSSPPADERDRQLEKAKTPLPILPWTKGGTDCVLGFVKGHLTADPERSDTVHDLLAFLAEGMV